VSWWKNFGYSMSAHNDKLVLASMVANNPERSQVLYNIFSSENLINFDEVWKVLDGFGTDYFIRNYEKMLQKDKRPKIQKFIRYFLGKLYLEKGDDSKAREYFEEVLNDPDVTDEYCKLLYARTCEGMALASSGSDRGYWTEKMYETFPQLVPFSDLKMNFRLEIQGYEGDTAMIDTLGVVAWMVAIAGLLFSFMLYMLARSGRMKMRAWISAVPLIIGTAGCVLLLCWQHSVLKSDPVGATISELRHCRVGFDGDENSPLVKLNFEQEQDALRYKFTVYSPDQSRVLVSGGSRITPLNGGGNGKLLAYDLFGVFKKKIGDGTSGPSEDPGR